MNVQLDWEDPHRLVLTCAGSIGWDDHDTLPQRITAAITGRPAPQLLMNMESVDFVNSAGIGALLVLLRLTNQSGGTLVLANVPPRLRRLFNTVGLDRVLPLVDTLDNARNYLAQRVGS